MRRKKILIHSNFCKAFTGFGKHKRNILRYLHSLDKYDIVELANGHPYSSEELKKMPWKCIGSMPDDRNMLMQIAQDQSAQRQAGYGYFGIDKAILEEKPDVYIGIEDIWGLRLWEKPWWPALTPMIWTTLDSLPILADAYEGAKNTPNFYVWSSFAEKAMQEEGYDNVETLHGTIDPTSFYRLSNEERSHLRMRCGIEKDDFIIGFVFRNQLRKSVPNILDGFNMFMKQNPTVKAKLLLHTCWSEGWDIPRLLKEKEISNNLILTTYFCPKCGQFEIKPFSGEGKPCRFCGTQNTQNTTNIRSGVNEYQLNEVYNLMDVYCHPFTSGGQEIPVQEAKLTELITLVTDYSCGEDHCTPQSAGFPLEWAEYREPGTQFIKASTYASSICKQLKKVYEMTSNKRKSLGKKARQFVIDNYSTEAVGKQLEKILDSLPFIEEGAWEEFDNKAEQERALTVQDVLDKEDEGKRILVAMPQALPDVLFCNSLISNMKKNYPEYNIYFATNPAFFGAIDTHPDIHKVIPFHPVFENFLETEGNSEKDGLFEIAFLPYATTQKTSCYTHNGKDVISFDL
jgi:glycosyltransferase involved in cell wall biosynthesis